MRPCLRMRRASWVPRPVRGWATRVTDSAMTAKLLGGQAEKKRTPRRTPGVPGAVPQGEGEIDSTAVPASKGTAKKTGSANGVGSRPFPAVRHSRAWGVTYGTVQLPVRSGGRPGRVLPRDGRRGGKCRGRIPVGAAPLRGLHALHA